MSSAQRILRYKIPVDDNQHMLDLGPIVHVASRSASSVEVWALESPQELREFRVVETDQDWPSTSYSWVHVGTAISPRGSFVWHLIEKVSH